MINRVVTQRQSAFLLFFIGLFSKTQINIGGKIGISELIMVLCAPYVFLKLIPVVKRDGNLYFFWLIILWLLGAIFSDFMNHTYFRFAMRGIAVPITIFGSVVCIYSLLRKDYSLFKWLILGCVITELLSIFFLQGGMAGDVASEQGLEAGVQMVVGYKLFWVNQLSAWMSLPIKGWYLQMPKLFILLAVAFLSVFSLATGGRSSFMIAVFTFLLFLFAGKTQKSILFIRKHVVTIIILICIAGFCGKMVYKYAATNGYLGQYEEDKYFEQTKEGSGILNMLMAGRSEFFIGLIAALDAPIIGHGSVAIDDKGYVGDFLQKYGSDAYLMSYIRSTNESRVRFIPYHTHIITYWMWHGIFGLIFWVCTIVLALKTFLFRLHIYPPWFGYFAFAIPAFMWNVLFSPLGGRVAESGMFVMFLLASQMSRNRGMVSYGDK